MVPTGLREGLKKIDKNLSVKIRFSERDQAPRVEIYHVDNQSKKYIVRGWSEKEFRDELETFGIGKILSWFTKAKKVMQSNAQERLVAEMTKRNIKKQESRHKKKMDEVREVASSNKVRNIFKDLAEASGL